MLPLKAHEEQQTNTVEMSALVKAASFNLKGKNLTPERDRSGGTEHMIAAGTSVDCRESSWGVKDVRC